MTVSRDGLGQSYSVGTKSTNAPTSAIDLIAAVWLSTTPRGPSSCLMMRLRDFLDSSTDPPGVCGVGVRCAIDMVVGRPAVHELELRPYCTTDSFHSLPLCCLPFVAFFPLRSNKTRV